MEKNKEWLKQELSKQINILHTTISSGNYVSLVKRAEIFNLIDQLEEPEQEKVVIPQFVADWITNNWLIDKYVTLERFMCDYNSVDLPSELYNYYDNNKKNSRDKVINGILDGYTVEKEKLYRVVFPFTGSSEKTLIQSIFTGNTWADNVEDDFEIIAEDHKIEFTEQEIKAIDERYLAFKVEVME